MRKVTVSEVIQAIVSEAEFGVYGDTYEGIKWAENYDGYKPTKEEFENKKIELENEYDAKRYQRDRASNYPSIQDQLDTLYHQGYDGWKEMIDEVKNKYPKP